MSAYSGPEIPNDGLVCMLDAANIKSYNPAENLLLYSQALTTSPWLNANCNSSNGQIAPDGTSTATLYTCNGTAPTLFYQIPTTAVTGTGILTSSVYAKASTSTTFTFNTYYVGDTEVNITFTLTGAGSTDTPASSTITAVGNGWYRCSILTPARVNTGTDLAWRIWPTVRATATAGLGCYFWGAQLNKGNYLRPYTATTSSVINATTTWVDISGNNNNGTSTSLSIAALPTVGNVVDFNTSSVITASFSSPVDKNSWSLQYWVRSTGLTPSDYRGIVQLVEPNASFGYFYNVDTRQTTNTYVLGYQKDYLINDWLTYGYMNQAQWTAQGWWCLGVSYNNKVFRFYTNGQFVNTQTQTRNVDGYGNLTQMKINYSGSNTVYMGPIQFYRGILTDAQFNQSFQAYRGRFGI